jgi:hypothetical protein
MFYLEVDDICPARDRQRPRPRHDVTWQSLNMDLFKAETMTGCD